MAEKTRLDLDKEIGGATNEKVKASDEHFQHWSALTLNENDENERKRRHDTQVRLNTALVDKKIAEIARLEDELRSLEERFAQWKEV